MAPGLLLGLMVGRLGCLLGGCCAGRPTSSRWGVWSSDRSLGVRRVPVQLFESCLAGVAGALALTAIIGFGANAGGLIFVAGFAAYTAGRQVLFPAEGHPPGYDPRAEDSAGFGLVNRSGGDRGAVGALRLTGHVVQLGAPNLDGSPDRNTVTWAEPAATASQMAVAPLRGSAHLAQRHDSGGPALAVDRSRPLPKTNKKEACV